MSTHKEVESEEKLVDLSSITTSSIFWIFSIMKYLTRRKEFEMIRVCLASASRAFNREEDGKANGDAKPVDKKFVSLGNRG